METLTDKVILTIDGKDYGKEFNFLNIVLKQELLKPNELTFTLQRKKFHESIKDKDFTLSKEVMGAKVECEIVTRNFDKKDILAEKTNSIKFKGIIFNVRVYRRSDMTSEQLVDVQAFTPDYLLNDHPHCYSYEEMSLKDIVNKTLEPYAILNKIKPATNVPIPYTVQYNESNFQFLARLAQHYGAWMYSDGVNFIFGDLATKDPVELDARHELHNYSFQADLMHHKVKHAHHDYLAYENQMKSDSDFPKLQDPVHGLADAAREKSAKLFTKETFRHVRYSNPETCDASDIELTAQTQLLGEKTQQVVCAGSSARGDLTIGSVITFPDYFFDGNDSDVAKQDALLVTGIVHSTEVDGHYSNRFTAHPAKNVSPPYYQIDSFPFSAAQRALVMDNKDPEKLGRIRVQFLWQKEQDPDMMTPWIRIAQPHGGGDKGFYYLPEIDEEVIVDFENANAEKPYVAGALYHGKEQRPDEEWYTDGNDVKAIRTRNGHTIEIRDEGSDGYIRIYDYKKENYVLTFSTDDKLIKLESTGNIELYAEKDIIMEAGDNMKIKVGKNKDVDVSNNLSIKVGNAKKVEAASITEAADGAMKLTSATHEQKANAAMKLEAGATLEAKGALVKIN